MTAKDARLCLARFLSGSELGIRWDMSGLKYEEHHAVRAMLEEVLLGEWVVVLPETGVRAFSDSGQWGGGYPLGSGTGLNVCVLRKADPDDGEHASTRGGCPCGAKS